MIIVWPCPSKAVFFNLVSEVEPFAAILIAHRTHVFFWGEGGNLRPKAEIGRRVLGEGQ